MKKPPPLFIILALLMLLLAPFIWHFMPLNETAIKEADDSYKKGEVASSIDERKKNFNQALDKYISLEDKYHPVYGNGKLFFNIGNTYFQLGEYPRAILYYERALSLRPRDEHIQQNLKLAEEKAGVQISQNHGISKFKIFSLPEILVVFFGLGFVSFIFYSIYIWSKSLWAKKLAIVSLCAALFPLIGIFYYRYLAPVEAVLVHSSFLKRDAGEQYARVNDQPIPAGTTVEVIEMKDQGKWYKVITPANDVGFVPVSSIVLVDAF